MSRCLFRDYGLKPGENVRIKEPSIEGKQKKSELFQDGVGKRRGVRWGSLFICPFATILP